MILIKVGGGREINWNFVAEDLRTLIKRGEKVILVHGANALMKDISAKLGIKEIMITSPSGHTSRYTDQLAMGLLTMVYSGLANKKIIATLQRHGINAVGLTGADGNLWLGKRKKIIYSLEKGKVKMISDSLTGNVLAVNSSLIRLLLNHKYAPVVTLPAVTAGGELINVDTDRAVAVMVKGLNLKKVVFLFEAPGLLKDPQDKRTVIKKIKRSEIDDYIQNTTDRMKKKLLGVKEALNCGAKQIYFGDGRIKQPILNALKGKGTVFSSL